MGTDDYWRETIESACEECGLTATQEQIACLAESAMLSHENAHMAFGPIPENPLRRENEELRRELKKERAKQVCSLCGGKGTITMSYATRSSTSECHKCHGEGRL